MYAVINNLGYVVSFENEKLMDKRFIYIDISSDVAVDIRAERKNGKIPMYVNGEFVFKDPKRPETWESIREKRKPKLEESDTMIFKISDDELISGVDNHSLKVSWSKYRQDLRDITASFEKPEDVVWPTKPA